jgi:hypothetical protein
MINLPLIELDLLRVHGGDSGRRRCEFVLSAVLGIFMLRDREEMLG